MTEDQLKPLLTDEFLHTLAEAAKVCGWSVDHVGTCDFVRWCHEAAEKDFSPSLDPYDND